MHANQGCGLLCGRRWAAGYSNAEISLTYLYDMKNGVGVKQQQTRDGLSEVVFQYVLKQPFMVTLFEKQRLDKWLSYGNGSRPQQGSQHRAWP